MIVMLLLLFVQINMPLIKGILYFPPPRLSALRFAISGNLGKKARRKSQKSTA